MNRKLLLSVVAFIFTLSILNLAAPANATGDYSVGGFDDNAAFERFYDSLRKTVAQNDKQATAALFSYPMTINFPPKKKLLLSSKADMVKNYDRIFNPLAKKALQTTKTSELFANCQGVMIGSGQIWFVPGEKGGVIIRTVNVGR